MKQLMIQGTASSVGKSRIATGLCRIYARRGDVVNPFKSQNMSRFTQALQDGRVISRIQALQARAAKQAASVEMNPVLLKPVANNLSELYLLGEKVDEVNARSYYRRKKELLELAYGAWRNLALKSDRIILEGAGSPAEINLRQHDLVNMGFAERVNAPVLLVGDIDRGGVFASLYGTYALLDEKDRSRIRAFVINKFRGDPSLLKDGILELEARTGIPCLGVIPYEIFDLEEEDSLSDNQSHSDQGVEFELDRLADFLEEHLDMERLETLFA